MLVDHQVADLPVHFLDGRSRDLGIVRCLGQPLGWIRLPELEVGHVDVHDAVQPSQRFQPVVAAGIVDQRQSQAPLGRHDQCFEDLRHDMAGRDQVDVVAAQFLQAKHLARQLLGGDRPPVAFPTDVEVLAEHAAQAALAEENCAGACPAPQAIFLAVMGKGIAHHGQPPGVAVGPGAVAVTPVGVAQARAAGAVRQGFNRLAGSAGKLTVFQQFHVTWPNGSHRTTPEVFILCRTTYSYYCDSRYSRKEVVGQ
jgi:hypothetical protein